MKNLFTLVLLALLASSAIGQGRGGGQGRNMDPDTIAARQTQVMKDSLLLSDAQADKIFEINLAYAKKQIEIRKAAREAEDFDPMMMRELMKSLRQEQSQKIKAMLTTEQSDRWNEIQEARRAKRKEKGGRGGRGGGRGH